MSITVGKHSFDGPYSSTDKLQDRSGVYAIHCHRNDKYYLMDVGESATVKTRVENHDRKDCWQRNCPGSLTFSAYYTPDLHQAGRMEIEQEIRKQFDPPCGGR
jgi:hypothetical protein